MTDLRADMKKAVEFGVARFAPIWQRDWEKIMAESRRMTDRELMQQVLDAMLNFPNDISDEMFESIRVLRARLANEFNPDWDAMAVMVEEQQRMAKRIEELEAALAQPEQELEGINEVILNSIRDSSEVVAPPQRDETPAKAVEWQGLTTQEIADETDIATSSNKDIFDFRKAFWCGARWAEEKLKEKNAL